MKFKQKCFHEFVTVRYKIYLYTVYKTPKIKLCKFKNTQPLWCGGVQK